MESGFKSHTRPSVFFLATGCKSKESNPKRRGWLLPPSRSLQLRPAIGSDDQSSRHALGKKQQRRAAVWLFLHPATTSGEQLTLRRVPGCFYSFCSCDRRQQPPSPGNLRCLLSRSFLPAAFDSDCFVHRRSSRTVTGCHPFSVSGKSSSSVMCSFKDPR